MGQWRFNYLIKLFPSLFEVVLGFGREISSVLESALENFIYVTFAHKRYLDTAFTSHETTLFTFNYYLNWLHTNIFHVIFNAMDS